LWKWAVILDETDKGHNEKLIRTAIKPFASCSLHIATKGGATRPQGGWGLRGGGHPKKLKVACEASL
jgi:aryl-alcohol dehydrogenase-like predicted oxidoreductase